MLSILSTRPELFNASLLAQASGPGPARGLFDLWFIFLVIIVLLAVGVMLWKRRKNKQFLVTVVVVLFAIWALLTFSGMFE